MDAREVDKLIDDIMDRVAVELYRATELHGPFNSSHEGYAVIKEELDELWDEIKNKHTNGNLLQEAIQVAAMAIRFIMDCVPDYKST